MTRLRSWLIALAGIGVFALMIGIFVYLTWPKVIWEEVSHEDLSLAGVTLEIDGPAVFTKSDSGVPVVLTNETDYQISGLYSMEKNIDGVWMRGYIDGGKNMVGIALFTSEVGVIAERNSTGYGTASFQKFLPKVEPGEYRLALNVNADYEEYLPDGTRDLSTRKRISGYIYTYFTIE